MVAIFTQKILFASAQKLPQMKYWKYDRHHRCLRYVKSNCEVELEKIPDWLELVDWIFYLHSQGLEPAALEEFIALCGRYLPQLTTGKPI
ncbi:MAG: hypothetical protein N4J56_006541 [Chroococcidiopsis sp. SAG 2025]|uniref:hypothetical protein n=1 Tax=Chroococcidiopsis sp. SAG 2025 TaxID=171389 RepID=UPI002937140D|nr:hypothetical protein [Chroococcidiopsis sp. SAG 2025]MDV2996836.1 hypothetical protein [Chroococcidiopsis sp. SAG 2025]